MSIDEPQFTYAQESKQPESPTMIVCNHCGHIARDGLAMDVHWDTYRHHKSHGAHPLGSDPKDTDRLRDQQWDLLKKMGLTVAGEHAAAQAAIISEAKAHQWEHKQPDPRLGQTTGAFIPERIFTRGQVLAVLETYRALSSARQRDDVNDLIAIFSGMR